MVIWRFFLSKYRTFVSVLTGLSVGLLLFTIYLFYTADDLRASSPVVIISTILFSALFFYTVGFVVSCVFVLIFGWPLYVIVKKWLHVNIVLGMLCGIVVISMSGVSILFLGAILDIDVIDGFDSRSALLLYVGLAVCGLAGGAVFAWLDKK